MPSSKAMPTSLSNSIAQTPAALNAAYVVTSQPIATGSGAKSTLGSNRSVGSSGIWPGLYPGGSAEIRDASIMSG